MAWPIAGNKANASRASVWRAARNFTPYFTTGAVEWLAGPAVTLAFA